MPVPQTTAAGPRRALLKDQAYAALRGAIVSGELPPGTRLREVELLERFGATRASLRDAIRRLALQGLVVVKPQSGTFVAPLDLRALRDELTVLAEITTSSVRAALPELRGPRLESLSTAVRAIDGAADDGPDGADAEVTWRRVQEVYEIVVAAAGNAVALELFHSIADQLARAFAATDPAPIREVDVVGIVDGVRREDVEAAVSSTVRSFDALDELLAHHGGSR